MSSRSQYVEVQLEIGHRATPKLKQTIDGHTHDWTVFVRGPEISNIQHFVEKVVFHLHESFPKPKRVVKEPPYQVSESGYAGFELPVEVYFKNKEEPKKICFDYDLYLRVDDAVSNTRREKLTFQNPSNEFKKKLLKAGGATKESNVAIAKSSTEEKQSTTLSSNISTNFSKSNKTQVNNNETKKTKACGVIPSKGKSLNSQHSTTISLPIPAPLPTTQEKHHLSVSVSTLASNNQFTDLFGPPIQKTCDTKNKVICQFAFEKSPSLSTSKSNKTQVNNETKKTKACGVIPSKDKSLNSQHSTTTSIPAHHSLPTTQEKHHLSVSVSTLAPNNQFTDLFGPPIKKTCDTKNKVICQFAFEKSPSFSTSKPNNQTHNSSKVRQKKKKKIDLIVDNICDTLINDTTEHNHSHNKTLSSLKLHDSVLYTDLSDIHKKLNESTDPELLQKVVDIIEDSGLYTMTSTSFDFDLMKLDKTTIQKLNHFLN